MVETVQRRLGPVAWVTILAALGVLVALGTWQVKRLVWKEGLLATIAERMAAEPAPLSTLVDAWRGDEDFEYRPVRAAGVFEHTKEQFFFATHNGQPGYFVYTPLLVADGSVIFINRGFVGIDRKDRNLRADGLLTGTVSVSGLARAGLTEKPSSLVPDNDPQKNIFYWKDIAAMARNAGLDPAAPSFIGFFIDADATPVPGGEPVGGVTQVNLPNNHLQYAITWYGLALALAGVTAAVWWRQRKG